MNADTPALRWWLTLQLLPQAGGRTRVDLLESFGSIEALFAASDGERQRVIPDRPEALAALRADVDDRRLDVLRQWLSDDVTHHLVTWADADYPALLRQIPDPPVVLYVVGDRHALTCPQLAVVGSRNATPAGLDNARHFSHALAQAGLAITSGLALGVDGAAHRGALDANGVTLAVCGTGLDRVYPARHRELAHAIARQGALISEFPLGTSPRPEHFPIRNRLISGLALGTLVVEAALQSGSLITARVAAEQGREVFAIPGSIHSPLSRGCHALIRQGAKLVETAQDVLEELGALAKYMQMTAHVAVNETDALAPELERLLGCLGYDPVTLDMLVERSGLTAGAVSSMLVALELRGLVAAAPGGRFQRLPGSSGSSSDSNSRSNGEVV